MQVGAELPITKFLEIEQVVQTEADAQVSQPTKVHMTGLLDESR